MEQFGDPTNNVHKHPITTLKEVAKGPLSYGSVSSAVEYDGETRYVRITDITDDGALGNDIKSATKTEDKYLLHEGDILFARTGATVGKTCRYREKYGRAIYAGFLIRLVPNTNLIDPDYLYHFSRSFFADSSYMLSFSVLCSCVCSRLISPSVSSWHKQDNTLMHQSPGHIQRRTPYNF